MPLKKGNTNIGAIYKGTTQIAKVYKGTKLLFENAKWLDYLFEYIYHSLIPTTISGKTVQDKAKLTKISGNGVVENQLVQNGNFEDNSIWLTEPGVTLSILNGIATVTNTVANNGITQSLNFISGHKYLVIAEIKTDESLTVRVGSSSGASVQLATTPTSVFSKYSGIFTCSSNSATFYIFCNNKGTFQVKNVMLIDLTLMFGTGNEPTTLTDNRIQALLNRGYIPYNTGSYKNSRVGEIETFNTNNQLLDTITLPGLLELNGAINSHDTFEITNTGYVFTRNIGVVGNFSSVSKNDYYSNLTGISCYEFRPKPYSGWWDSNDVQCLCNKLVVKNFDSNSEINYIVKNASPNSFLFVPPTEMTLEQATTVIQTLEIIYPLATPQVITIPKKHLGCVDLGSLNWTYNNTSGHERFVATNVIDNPNTSNSTIANIFCNKYITDTIDHTYTHSQDKIIATANGTIQVYDSTYTSAADFKSAMAGQYLFYETDAEVSDFDNIAQINAGGSITSNWFSWVRNQLCVNGNFSNETFGWSIHHNKSTYTYTNGGLMFTITTAMSNSSWGDGGYAATNNDQRINLYANHKYFITCEVYTEKSGQGGFYYGDSYDPYINVIANEWQRVSSIRTQQKDSIGNVVQWSPFYCEGMDVGTKHGIRNMIPIDLTIGFGAGKEPTDINDPRIQHIINNGYIPYDTGTEESVAPEVLPNVNFEIKCK